MTILFNVISLVLILLVIYWFWLGKKSTSVAVNSEKIRIIVADGVYKPSVIRAKTGEKITLEFFREDSTPCSEFVIFNGINQSAQLPIGKPKTLIFTVNQPGEYEFTCQMGMYRGKLLIFS